MSGTVRRKKGIGWCYGINSYFDILEDRYWNKETETFGYFHHDLKSKEGKKRIALFHADNDWYGHHGPSWWRRQYYQRPYRRFAEREIQKAVSNDEYDAIIPDKPKLGYWD
jgi:hypothetical protein